jgi:regulatory protein
MARRGGSGRRETLQEARERHSRVDDPQLVSDAAVRFLEARHRSVAEVRRRLTMAGYQPALVEGAIDRLLAVGLLDDLEFGRLWVRSRDASRPRGEQALRRELMLKGLDREIIATVLAERAGDDEPTAAQDAAPDRLAADRLLQRRRSTLERESDPAQRRRRAYALLARNGFDPDVCADAVRRFMSAAEGDDAGNDPG